MAMFKGVTTLQDYEECLKRGLCEEHIKEIGQNELAMLKHEFPRKAFHYIRINILYPLLFKKSPKLEKIKKLMEKTPSLSKILLGGDISEAADTIFILDSVIIFTLCQLSQICCIGALFHIKKKNSDDPKLKPLRQLLLVDQLDKSIVYYLYPVLQKNFIGYNTDIIKASHIITLIFVRNFCTRFNMKTAIENIEKDIKGDKGWENFKTMADDFYTKKKFEEASKSYISALIQNVYSPELYSRLADCYLKCLNFRAGQLYAYLAVTVKPTSSEAYCQFATSLILQGDYEEAGQIIYHALKVCEKSEKVYSSLKVLRKGVEDHINGKEFVINQLKKGLISNDSTEKKESGEKCQTVSVKLIDSDSAESENESEVCKKAAELNDADFSDESETTEKKLVLNTQEKTKSKPSGSTKKKRTLSEGLPDIPVEEELDVAKINAFLKEASETLLADCGYKAVQIFRGPLRNFMESQKLFSFEECDIVCIRYSYGIAYCKSGGYDDLQKCITILKDIIENHDSITFPAAYYSIGLAYRKLNRFKEALNYLEIVQNFLCKGIHFKVYPWPGMTTVIQETKPDVLKTLVQDLIKECENPPNPDAFCRYVNCEYQPSIYYTDPDFKGYVSLSCSEQCCMQYHFLCWKAMKTEKQLTDKEFLEKACFTPDCEGVIVKIQNIDKKGDLSKEFTSDLKKHSKQKWAKWEKKTESKEKKRKKINNKSDEISNGNERKNSSNVDDESPSPQPSGSSGSVEETNKLENFEKSSLKVKESVEINVDPPNDTDSSSEKFAEMSTISSVVEDNKELNDAKQVQENETDFYLNECIKNNVYAYMDDFLQHHGPLKIDDPLLIDEIESFPEEVHIIIAECGGVGEFLKEDLRFAYVGDMYVCVVADLATAYKMCSSSSLPTDFKSLQSLSNIDNTKSYKCNTEALYQNIGLNPDAMEYTPSNVNKSNHYKFVPNNPLSQNLNSDSPVFVPATFEHSSEYITDVHQTSNSNLDTFPEGEIYINKFKNCEALVKERSQNDSELIFCTPKHSKTSKYCDNSDSDKSECTYQPTASSESPISDCKVTNGSVSENVVPTEGSIILENSPGTTNLEFQLLKILKMYYSEDMKSSRQKIDSYIKPFVIKRLPDLAASGTMTDFELMGEDFSKVNALSEQNLLFTKKLEAATVKQQQLTAEVSQLQKQLKEMEAIKKQYENKEDEMLDGRKYLLESLTSAHETIDNQKRKLALLTSEKNSLQKTVDNLSLSMKENEEKFKCALDVKEKHFNNIILNLQNERDEFKNRAKYAELQVFHLKKTEYLKKIEEKSIEATKKRKELTDCMSIVSSNPVVQSNMKALSTQLLSYVNNLNDIKLDFMRKMDEEIEKIKNGTPLREIKELEMEKLPEIPCWNNLLSSSSPALDKHQALNPMINFGLNMGSSHPVSSSTFNSFIPDAPVIPGIKVPPAKIVSTGAVIGPSAATVAPPPLSSALKSKTSSKTELSNVPMDFGMNSQIEESFKNAMASINSFASTPYVVPPLDDEFQKNCVLFKHPDPVPAPISKPNIPKVPPGIQTPIIHTVSERTVPKIPIPEPVVSAACSSKEKRLDSLDTVPLVNSESTQSTWEEKKKTVASKNSYEKLLNKLQENFPQYSQVELISFVKEFRTQKKGKLSGQPMETIINDISNLIIEKKMSEKKISEARVLPKSTKVLVNKKLVPDSKPPITNEQQSVKKKTAWGNIDSDAKRRFSGSPDDDCVICRDSMSNESAYKVSCGHTFHEDCIRAWLLTKSNCPVCRTLLLLPEEYPSLS